jgi:hypothetical protein
MRRSTSFNDARECYTMIEQTLEAATELERIDSVVQDATALFEQYEPMNDASAPAPDEVCENLYAMPQ